MTSRLILMLGALTIAAATSGCIIAPEHRYRQAPVAYAPPPPPPRPYYRPPPPPEYRPGY